MKTAGDYLQGGKMVCGDFLGAIRRGEACLDGLRTDTIDEIMSCIAPTEVYPRLRGTPNGFRINCLCERDILNPPTPPQDTFRLRTIEAVWNSKRQNTDGLIGTAVYYDHHIRRVTAFRAIAGRLLLESVAGSDPTAIVHDAAETKTLTAWVKPRSPRQHRSRREFTLSNLGVGLCIAATVCITLMVIVWIG